MPSFCYIPNDDLQNWVYLCLLHRICNLLAYVAVFICDYFTIAKRSWPRGQGMRLHVFEVAGLNPIQSKFLLIRGLCPSFFHFIKLLFSCSRCVCV